MIISASEEEKMFYLVKLSVHAVFCVLKSTKCSRKSAAKSPNASASKAESDGVMNQLSTVQCVSLSLPFVRS